MRLLLIWFVAGAIEVATNYLIFYGQSGPHVWEVYPFDGSPKPPAPPMMSN